MLSFSLYTVELEEEERDKLDRIYAKYKKIMTIVAHEKVGIYQAEEDVVHNAILKLIKYLDRIDLEDPKSAIFVKVVTNSCAMDWLKHRKLKFPTGASLEDIPVEIEDKDTLPPNVQMINEEGYDRVVECIRSIGKTYRDTCELRFIFNMSEKEIADILNISVKNVGIRVLRGRKEIIKKLRCAGYDVEAGKKRSNV